MRSIPQLVTAMQRLGSPLQADAQAGQPATGNRRGNPAMSNSDRLSRAFGYATHVHAGQLRKGTAVPYISHPLAVCALVLEYGGDEDQAIAALLHDVIEDDGARHASQINQYFGERVLRMVLDCTDALDQAELAWLPRKQRYLAHLAEVGADSLLVNACDKLHNARCILRDLEQSGVATLERFSGGRDGVLWYYRSLDELFTRRAALPAPALGGVVASIVGLAA